MNRVQEIEKSLIAPHQHPAFSAGDTVAVDFKIIEGNKERIQTFQGIVLQRRGSGIRENFTVRKISGGVGVEKIFPIYSPLLTAIVVVKRGKVRRARLFYLRDLKGALKVKERRRPAARIKSAEVAAE